MTSQKPYLIRAIYQWLNDNGCTPFIMVDTLVDGVQVPEAYIQDNRIVLNIAPDAVQGLHIDNEWISFSARFAGKATQLFIPVTALQAIYARENNEGMFFPEEDDTPPTEPTPSPEKPVKKIRPSLTVVK
jgi:stringent starvation protein B